MKTEYDDKAYQNTLTKQFFKRKNLGICPNRHTLCTDAIINVGGVKRKRGPVPGHGASQKKKKGRDSRQLQSLILADLRKGIEKPTSVQAL
jgi:hypothetical protein